MKRGTLFVVSGPSGVGKGTIINKVLADNPNISFSISATTRKQRPGEENGVQYYFITKEDFLKKIENDEFLEWSEHFDNYYGTLKKVVYEKLDSGKDIILDIEVNGANTLLNKKTEAKYIFIKPPSSDVLRERLLNRNTESDEKIKKRLERAEWEMSFADRYDYVIVNDILEKAVQDLESIVKTVHLKKVQK